MAVDAVRYGSRGRKADAQAAKERREKIMLAVGGAVLVLLLAWQGPKTLKVLHGASMPATAPSATSPGAAVHGAGAKPVDLKRLARFAAKDVFFPQLDAPASTGPKTTTATPPAVRTSHFRAKDPFEQQLTLSDTAPAAPVQGGGGAAPAAGASYIVMLASIPVSDGRSSAERAAALARKRGVDSVKIVVSSNYSTLRSGFYAVYSGPYTSLDETLNALERVRGQGYVSSYTRRIAR